jgi:hypothetical protein
MDKRVIDFIPKEEAEPNVFKERMKHSFRIVLAGFAIASLISLFLFFILEVPLIFCLIPFLVVSFFFAVYFSDNPPCLW